MKVGDLVMVDFSLTPKNRQTKPFVSVIVDVCLPEDQVNGMYLIKVLEKGTGAQWYPSGYIEVINEAR